MFKSILTTAFRNLFRNRSFSLINMIGLSVSMSLALLVILVIREQYTYDNFHQDANRIYRVNTTALRVEGGSEDYASVPLPIGHVFKEDYTFAEEVVRINRRFNGDAQYGTVNLPVAGLFVDPSFLKVFNFPLEKGNPANALAEPNSLVITLETAQRLFGDREPLGQTLSVGSYGEFTVTGVLKAFPSKTHFEFEVLGSLNALPGMEQRGVMSPSLDNWNNYYGNYVYFKLKEGGNLSEAENALQEITKKFYANLPLETRDKGYEFFLLPLTELTPGPMLSNQMGTGMPDLLIIFFSVLVGIVMIMACFNYTNLTIAKSLSRAREIGVRKVVGAKRFQVFTQFIGEAVVFAIICLVFSYLILQFMKPAYMQLSLAREFAAVLQEDYVLIIYFLLFAIGIGVLAGILPASYLSALRPAKVLKDSGNLKVYSRLTFRKALIVIQFTLSIVFIIVVLVIHQQINYMVTTDYGINDKNILNVRLQGMEFEKLANEIKSVSGVVSVGGVSHRLGTWQDRSSDYKRNESDEPFVMRDFIVDNNYIDNVNMEFLAGKNFNPEEQGEREKHVILNQQALQLFGFSDPISAVGQPIYADDSVMLTVLGVVKDFHFRPLSYQIGPVAFRYKTAQLGYLSILIAPSQKEVIVASLESIWKKLDPVHPLEWMMMEDEIDEAYASAGFFDILKIVGYISFLVISLACLGMLGMAMYSTQTRMKEIGVRKVMGATSGQVTMLLSKSFLILLGIAASIATPLGYLLGDEFLNSYAYKIQITPLLLLTGIVTVGLLGMITIGSQTWRAASSNPVKSLRYE
jgi:putative ABC transport system permease protein